jgi:hypothetical protein
MPRADRSREALLDLDGLTVVLDAGRLLEDFWVAVDRMLKLRED